MSTLVPRALCERRAFFFLIAPCCNIDVDQLEGIGLSLRFHPVCFAIAAALAATGCSLHHAPKPPKPPSPPKERIGGPSTLVMEGKISMEANSDSVIPFDVVAIQDKTLLKQVSQMDAATWFGPKGRCTFRDGAKAKAEFYSWEFVPGQTFLIDAHIPRGTKAVFGFADYSTPGEHRISMGTKGTQIVEMDKDGAHAVAGQAIHYTTLTLAPEKQKVCPDD